MLKIALLDYPLLSIFENKRRPRLKVSPVGFDQRDYFWL
jgi:hypothetical protein